MNAMIAPTIQQDLVTKKEFNEFRSEVNGQFIEIRGEIKEYKEEVKGYFERSIGVMHEKFRDDLKITKEYLEYVIRNPSSVR